MCFSLCPFVAQLLLAAPRTCPSPLRRHRSSVWTSRDSQRNRHSAARGFPHLDFWTGIVSGCAVIRLQLPTELEAIRWEPTVEEDRTG